MATKDVGVRRIDHGASGAPGATPTPREAPEPLTAEEEADLRLSLLAATSPAVRRLLATLDAERAARDGLREALATLTGGDLSDLGGLASQYAAVYKMHAVYHDAVEVAERAARAPGDGLRELRALSEAATPGPWRACPHVAGTDPECPCRYRGDLVSEATDEVLMQMGVGPDHVPDSDNGDWRSVPTTTLEQGYANGRFVLAAVNYVRASLASPGDAADREVTG